MKKDMYYQQTLFVEPYCALKPADKGITILFYHCLILQNILRIYNEFRK